MVITGRMRYFLGLHAQAFDAKSSGVEFWNDSRDNRKLRQLRMLENYGYLKEIKPYSAKYKAYQITMAGLAFYDEYLMEGRFIE